MEESISRPMFVLLRCFAEMVDDDSKSRSPITELLVELYKLQPKTGYFLFSPVLFTGKVRINLLFSPFVSVAFVKCNFINCEFTVKPANPSLLPIEKFARLAIWK